MNQKDKLITVNLAIPKELFDSVRENIIGDSLEEKFAKCLLTGYRVCKRKMPIEEG